MSAESGDVSLEDQSKTNTAWALDNGFTEIVEVVSEKISGARADRQGIARCLELAKSGQIDALVAYDFKRFSRQDELESAALLYQFKEARVKVLFANEPNGEDVASQVYMALRRIFSPMDKLDITARLQRGHIRSLTQRNRALGSGRRPFGLTYLKGKYRYEIIPEEACWIPRMVASVLDGQSLYSVAQTLTANGVRTTTGKDRWGITSVKSVLSNPLYTGVYSWGKHSYIEPQKRLKPYVKALKTTAVPKDHSRA